MLYSIIICFCFCFAFLTAQQTVLPTGMMINFDTSDSYGRFASAYLALKDATERNGAIVSNFTVPFNSADVVFKTIPLNSGGSSGPAMNVMLAMYQVSVVLSLPLSTPPHLTLRHYFLSQSLAALNGPARSSTTIPLALVGNFGSVPQVGSSQTSPALNDKSLYGNFARTVADDELTADAVVRFFKDTGLDYIGFVYVDDSYGNNFYNFLVSSADKYGLVHIGIPVPSTISKVDAQRIATQMLASGFTSWFNVIFPETYSLLMPEWNSLGMITPSQIFLFGDGLNKNSFSEFDYSLGQGIIQAIGAIPNSPQYNAFVNHWNEQGAATVDEMNTLIQTSALDPNTGMQSAQLFPQDFFQTPPDIDNPFYYDSMAATLLGAVATPFFEPIWRDVVPPGDSIREVRRRYPPCYRTRFNT